MKRSKVVLQFAIYGVGGVATDGKGGSARSGQVVYQLDEAGNFDESDPDDDLNI